MVLMADLNVDLLQKNLSGTTDKGGHLRDNAWNWPQEAWQLLFLVTFFLAFTVSGSRGKGNYTGAEAGWMVVAALPMLHSVPD